MAAVTICSDFWSPRKIKDRYQFFLKHWVKFTNEAIIRSRAFLFWEFCDLTLVDFVFLEICPFHADCPAYWCTVAHSTLFNPFYFCRINSDILSLVFLCSQSVRLCFIYLCFNPYYLLPSSSFGFSLFFLQFLNLQNCGVGEDS